MMWCKRRLSPFRQRKSQSNSEVTFMRFVEYLNDWPDNRRFHGSAFERYGVTTFERQ